MNTQTLAKKILKTVLPKSFLGLAKRYLVLRENRKWDSQFSKASPRDIFTSIYEKAIWGGSGDFYSGLGSHSPQMVEPYVEAVITFLSQQKQKLNAVDLGCGDFNVGRQIREHCDGYVACDIVPSLIARNSEVFKFLKVDFRCLDMSEEALPDGEVVFLRQVLQHMSNSQISKLVQKLQKYRWIVVTEHLPEKSDFRPNQEIPVGPGTRMGRGFFSESGVVLTAAPFDLKVKSEKVICEIPLDGSILRTSLYELNPQPKDQL